LTGCYVLVPQLFQHHPHLWSLLNKTGKRITDIGIADSTIIDPLYHGTFPDFTHIFGEKKLDAIGSATVAMDMLRLDIRMVLFGPFPGNRLSLMVIILPGSDICLTFFTVQSTTGYHKTSYYAPITGEVKVSDYPRLGFISITMA